MDKNTKKRTGRIRRHQHIRKKVNGTSERPRLCVFKSLKQIYVQAIDDENSATLVSSSSLDKNSRENLKGSSKIEVAFKIGESIAAKCKEKGIESVVFDRGGFKYQGRVSSLAEGARKAGLKF
ncbi:MAG: 50S ribosomal protein L18 [Planctomycetota bacterium]|nr:MAG: 50S ribosomal protein L18 [Planctomycetota bacterium]